MVHSKNTGGFTLLELMLSVALFGSILSALGLVARQSSRFYRQSRIEQELEVQLYRGLNLMARQLSDAGRELVPEPDSDFGTPALTFKRCLGFDGTDKLWSSSFMLSWQLEDGELDDGLDNNGNGLADEGVIVWTENVNLPSTRSVVKIHGVRELLGGETFNGADDNGNGLFDEPGLCFDIEGNVLTIFLTLETLDIDGQAINRTAQTAVRIRN